MKYKRWLILVIIMVVIYTGWHLWQAKQSAQKAPLLREIAVQVGAIREVISTAGIVEPQVRLELTPPFNGRLEKVLVQEGSYVQAGQPLLIISAADRALLLDAARAQGQDKIKAWQDVYKPATMVAPIKGRIIVRNAEPGQNVNSSTVVLVLADKLIVKAQADETDVGKISPGQDVLVTLDAYPDTVITGSVTHISYESKLVSNVTIYEIDIILTKVPAFVRSGMSTNVDFIIAESHHTLLIPYEALNYQAANGQQLTTVRLKDDSALGYRRQTVTTGLSQGGLVEVISGLRANDTLIVEELLFNNAESKQGSFLQRGGNRGHK